MSKDLLIDASHPEETRIAIKSDHGIEEYEYENIHRKNLKGNIYLGKVSRIEPSLQAAFVDFGNERHGFLAFNDIQSDYYQIPQADKDRIKKEEEEARAKLLEENDKEIVEHAEQGEDINLQDKNSSNGDQDEENIGNKASDEDVNSNEENHVEDKPKNNRSFYRFKRYRIQEVIKPGQIVLIQIVKEERGKKGAALTTFISLAGKYIVLMPNTAKGGGISRKIYSSSDRKKMKEIINDLELPKTMGLIVRTAGANKTKNEIKDDLTNLLGTWEEIRKKTLKSIAPSTIYEEEDLIARAIRDFYSKDIDSIIVDGDKAFEAAKKYAKKISSAHVKNIVKYKGKIPIFHHYNIEKYLNSIFEPRIELKSGGYIIISPTEALVSIDINSGRSTRERNVEKTALTNNLEAAEEIARQVKLRDLAGLIVIDFIDMENYSNKRLVERKLRESLKNDKARIQFGRISNFGLLEMTRQRLRESSIKWEIQLSVDSFALKILKLLEERAFSDEKIKIIDVSLSKKIIDILNNNYSTELKFFKDKYKFKINLVQNAEFLSQEFLFSFYDSKKKLISEFNGTEVKEPSLKEKDVSSVKEETKEDSEEKQETVDDKKHEGYKGKRKKFFNKNRFKDNKRTKKKETEVAKEVI
ncbi:MAG: Rne/Rng family ribonuclease [Proteobacteria bacterium]|uniref:Rne/Rng family ribonuclease n=4 Tax=Candidatus Fonsibacter lacus TaxID=2576439 RepID=A0A966HRH7_9PROT|nr:Rne/Rng family ribonuclease [Candidatus Fonsibacter lacus]NCU70096.1 Rne/Rng family ribonuclease [Candidatus Fonsibacter lacus]NDE49055.1 Rne/Rng family ribonuclease [Pseudomonadota bacterium]